MISVRALAKKHHADPKTIKGYLNYLSIPFGGTPLSVEETNVSKLEDFLKLPTADRKKILCEWSCLKKYGTPYHNDVEKAKQTTKERYGAEQFRNVEKAKQTKKERYGDPHFNNAEKAKQTCLRKYGFTTASQSPTIKQRCKQYFESKYGGNPSRVYKDKIIVAKSKTYQKEQESLEREFGPLYSMSQLKVLLGHSKTAIMYMIHSAAEIHDTPIITGVTQTYIPQNCIQHIYDVQRITGGSRFEEEVASYIESLGLTVQRRVKTVITPKELDVYVPEKQVAIECNGIYWHSDLPYEGLEKDAQQRHLEKTKACEEKGIRLIHIFEDDWRDKKNIVKSILAIAIGKPTRKLFARKCIVKSISLQEYRSFLLNNHLQGYSFANVRIGLYFEGDLVECIGVNTKGTHSTDPELVRLCTKQGYQVLGGFSKLMKATTIQRMVSYIDRATYSGIGYAQTGFTVLKVNPPTFFWTKGSNRIPRYMYMKKTIKKLYEQGVFSYFNECEPEWLNMRKNGYGRIWNCGTIKVVWEGGIL